MTVIISVQSEMSWRPLSRSTDRDRDSQIAGTPVHAPVPIPQEQRLAALHIRAMTGKKDDAGAVP